MSLNEERTAALDRWTRIMREKLLEGQNKGYPSWSDQGHQKVHMHFRQECRELQESIDRDRPLQDRYREAADVALTAFMLVEASPLPGGGSDA